MASTAALIYIPEELSAAGIQAAHDEAIYQTNGGLLQLPSAVINMTSMVTINQSFVTLVGRGGPPALYDPVDPTVGTILRATAPMESVLKFVTVSGAPTAISDVGAIGLTLDANEFADRALYCVSVRNATFKRLHLRNALVANLAFTVVGALMDGVEDDQALTLDQITIRAVDGAGAAAIGALFDGIIDVGNFSMNRIGLLQVRHANGSGVVFANSDSNLAQHVLVSRAPGGTGIGIEFKGSATLNKGHARANRFEFVDPGAGGVVSRANGLTQPAINNRIATYSVENGAPLPTVEGDPRNLVIETIQARGVGGPLLDLQFNAILEEEFLGGNVTSGTIGECGWSFTGGTMDQIPAEANHNGILNHSVVVTGTVAFMRLGADNDVTLLPADYFEVIFLVRLNQSTPNVQFRCGLESGGAGTAPPTGGMYIEKDTADANWFGVCRSASTSTRTASLGAVSAGGWARLRIRRVSATEIGFSVNGGTEAKVSTNVPAGAQALFTQIANSDGVLKSYDFDRCRALVAVSR